MAALNQANAHIGTNPFKEMQLRELESKRAQEESASSQNKVEEVKEPQPAEESKTRQSLAKQDSVVSEKVSATVDPVLIATPQGGKNKKKSN